MAFDYTERSNHAGQPVSLYEFRMASQLWCFSGGETATTLFPDTDDERVYEPVPISDTGVIQSGDINNDDMTITVPKTIDLVGLFAGTPPSEAIYVYLRRKHRGDTEAPIIWVGTVTNVKIKTATTAEIVCRMLTASFDRNGLRLSFSRGCPHALYDGGCKVSKASYATAIQVEALTGATITSVGLNAFATGYLAGGFFEWTTMPGVIERRPIEGQSGNVLNVLGTTDGLEVGDWITVYPGCDRTTLTCATKFNNLLNYGGFPHMPGKSPFDGDPVF